MLTQRLKNMFLKIQCKWKLDLLNLKKDYWAWLNIHKIFSAEYIMVYFESKMSRIKDEMWEKFKSYLIFLYVI